MKRKNYENTSFFLTFFIRFPELHNSNLQEERKNRSSYREVEVIEQFTMTSQFFIKPILLTQSWGGRKVIA